MKNLWLLIMFIGFPSPGMAQVRAVNACPSDAPISINVGVVPPTGGRAVATVTNKGPRPATAVILSWGVTDSNGAFYVEYSTTDYAPSGVMFEAGQTAESDVDLSVAEGRGVQSVQVSCLAVLYKGTAVWGDSKSPQVTRLRATRQGIAVERRRLLDIYKTQGIAKLVEEINRPVVR